VKDSAGYAKIVGWSEEDHCYVGSAPGLIYGGTYGDDEKAVFEELRQIVEEAIELYRKESKPLTPLVDAPAKGSPVVETMEEGSSHRELGSFRSGKYVFLGKRCQRIQSLLKAGQTETCLLHMTPSLSFSPTFPLYLPSNGLLKPQTVKNGRVNPTHPHSKDSP
jgi:predicted RNase H-like HicB family nuclease